jgi:hypothetical protein
MTTANTTMTAKEAYEIAFNDPIARIVNKSSLEDAIKTSPQYTYNYALNVIKGRWIDGEDIIKTNSHYAYNYAACVIKNRWIEGESIIKNSAEYAFHYAKHVIKGRWVEGEEAIKTNSVYAFDYATDVCKSRFILFEKYIIENKFNLATYGGKTLDWGRDGEIESYGTKFLGCRNPKYDASFNAVDGVPRQLHEAIKCYYHVIDVVKGRWIEAEDIIKQYDTVWSMYNEFLRSLPLTDDEWAEKVKNECQNILTGN